MGLFRSFLWRFRTANRQGGCVFPESEPTQAGTLLLIKKVAMQHRSVSSTPQPQGLYHPRNEHDACGMGLVASIRGEKSHDIIRKGLEVLINLTHRGAAGCDPETGDGAGILIQIPHVFFARECGELGHPAARGGRLRRGHVFSAGGQAQPPAVRGRVRAHRAGRGPDGSRLARYAGERRRDWPRSARVAALYRAVVCRPAEGHGRRGL